MKICNTCKTEKPFSEFHKDSRSSRKSDGYRGSCKICINKKNANWYEANKDSRKLSMASWELANKENRSERARYYYLENKDAYAARAKRYWAEYPERMLEKSRKYYRENKESHRAYVKSWCERNPDSVRSYAQKRRCSQRNADGSFSAEDIQKMFESQFGICTGCGNALQSNGSEKFHVDHIMPLALGGSNWPSNLQLLCPCCNKRKGAKHPDLWNVIKPIESMKNRI